jgi:hypothetical protein
MNSLQYIGKKISTVGLDNLNLEDMTSMNPRLLYPYLNAATDLDPKFHCALLLRRARFCRPSIRNRRSL